MRAAGLGWRPEVAEEGGLTWIDTVSACGRYRIEEGHDMRPEQRFAILCGGRDIGSAAGLGSARRLAEAHAVGKGRGG